MALFIIGFELWYLLYGEVHLFELWYYGNCSLLIDHQEASRVEEMAIPDVLPPVSSTKVGIHVCQVCCSSKNPVL